MPAVPLPFVIALFAAIAVIRLTMDFIDGRMEWPPVLFAALALVMVLVVALRWSTGILAFRIMQPYIALSLPPAAWLCFALLTRENENRLRAIFGHLAVMAGFIAVAIATSPWPAALDFILPLVFSAYGVALIRTGLRGENDFPGTRLGQTRTAGKAALTAGFMLIGSALVDLLVAVDFGFYQGRHVIGIVASANLLTLLLLVAAIAMVGRVSPAPMPEEQREDVQSSTMPGLPATEGAEDQAALLAFENLMHEGQLFRDPDLTLNRIARKARLPARHISRAVNRHFQRNLSQVVNEFRIEEAMRLLRDTSLPITSILFECGFQTKSNFNREFLRVTGKTPSEFRRSGDFV